MPTQQNPNTNNSDEALLRSSLEGDERAFTILYRRRQAGILRFLVHMCGSVEVAEDLTQEVFITLIREAWNFDPARGTVLSYLYGIARNQLRRVLDSGKSLIALDDERAGEIPASQSPLGDLTRMETITAVRQAVLALPEPYREAVVLCDLEEMSYADAASAIGIPIGTVRSRLSRGRALLVEKLRNDSAARKGFNATRCFA